ncbi:MAG: sialidase family protein [Planctomycetota bacterium]
MKIQCRGRVFQGEKGSDRQSACFHDICALADDRWLSVFRTAPRKQNAYPQRVLLSSSDDAGATWSAPVEPFPKQELGGKRGDWRAGHVTALGGSRLVATLYWVDASDPSLPFFNDQTEGLLDSRIFLAFSDDDGRSWSEPTRADTTPFNIPTPITGPILRLPNGQWGLQFETNKSYLDTSTWHHASVLMFSRDEGRTWPEHVRVAADPEARIFYWDQRLSVLADNTLLAVFWTFDREEAVYRNIHARSSRDSGRTWSEIWDTGLPGQPGPAVSLGDGRIAMPYVDRESTPVLKLRTSADGGRSWPDDTELVLDDTIATAQQHAKDGMRDAWEEMGAFSLGLPRTALLPSGDMLVAYYAGPETDHTAIHWVRLAAR